MRIDERDGLRDKPLGELLRDLAQEGQGLVREEVRLAKAEIRAEVKKAKKGGAAIGAGGVIGYAALLLLGATLVLLGSTFMPAWVAALIVTAMYAVAAGSLLSYGKNELDKADPSRAVRSLKEDGRWAKETMRDIRSTRSASA